MDYVHRTLMLDTFAHKYLLAIRLLFALCERNPSGSLICGLDRFDLHKNSLIIHRFDGRFLFLNLPGTTHPSEDSTTGSEIRLGDK